MSEEIKKIITLGDIFRNIETEEKAFKFKDYIKDLQQKVEQLENIIDVKKYDYDYLEALFSKSSKEEVLKAYTYKCEQLEKVMKSQDEFEMKSMQLENIINEAKEECRSVIEDSEHTTVSEFNINGLMRTILNILNKGE